MLGNSGCTILLKLLPLYESASDKSATVSMRVDLCESTARAGKDGFCVQVLMEHVEMMLYLACMLFFCYCQSISSEGKHLNI